MLHNFIMKILSLKNLTQKFNVDRWLEKWGRSAYIHGIGDLPILTESSRMSGFNSGRLPDINKCRSK